jgi:dTDP-4-dehydrorhamnose reductase
MRILFTGSNGLLGTPLVSLCIARGHEVFSGYAAGTPQPSGTPIPIDLTDHASLQKAFEQSRPEAVFHLAAMTDVDRCEVEKKLASRVNEEGTRAVAVLAKKAGAKLVNVSTDYVFSGTAGLYKEDEATLPINHYGYTKLMAEEAVVESGAEYLTIRPSVIYGVQPAMGKVNFALWVYESLKAGKEIRLLTDQYVSPTLNLPLTEMMLEACEKGLGGIYHMSGATRISRFGFGMEIAEAFGFNPELLKPAVMEQFQGKWIARRPPDSSLDTSKAAAALEHKPLTIGQALAEFRRAMLAKESR